MRPLPDHPTGENRSHIIYVEDKTAPGKLKKKRGDYLFRIILFN